MCENKDGILFFGNNDGVLVFDGVTWKLVKLPNSSSVRSLSCTEENKVYAGGYHEFGEIIQDKYGKYQYRSTSLGLSNEHQDFENIWDIQRIQDYMVFRSDYQLFAQKKGNTQTYAFDNVYYSKVIDSTFYLLDNGGLKTIDFLNQNVSGIIDASRFNHEAIFEVLSTDTPDELMLFAVSGNIYSYNLANEQLIKIQSLFAPNFDNQILSVIRTSDNLFFVGTIANGILMLDSSGVLIQQNAFPLQDKTVHKLYQTRDKNIWVMLNKGIDCINTSSPVKVVMEDASVYDVLITEDEMFLATNQGVFNAKLPAQIRPFNKLKFEKSIHQGPAWSMHNFNGHVLSSHGNGLFLLSEQHVEKIEPVTGVWKVIPIDHLSDHYLVCTYKGLYLLWFDEANGFKIMHQIQGFDESARDIAPGDNPGEYWICHGYKGVYHIKIDENYERVFSTTHYKEQGLPSPYGNNVFRWNDEIVFTTINGVYEFNEANGVFVPLQQLSQNLGNDQTIRKITQHDEHTWFTQSGQIGYFHQDNPTELNKGLFLEFAGTLNRGMESISPSNHQVIIGNNKGAYQVDLKAGPRPVDVPTLITSISFEGKDSRQQVPIDTRQFELENGFKNLNFTFAAPKLSEYQQLQFSYKLAPLDDAWSSWQNLTAISYTQLKAGEYTLQVRARNLLGTISQPISLDFKVAQVWYRSIIAYSIYLIVLIVSGFQFRKLIRNKIKREREKTIRDQEEKHKLLRLELKQLQLERDKAKITKDKQVLEEDLIYKSKELANYTLLLSKKKRLLTETRDELKSIRASIRGEKSRNELRVLERKLNIQLKDEAYVKVFEANFEHVHKEFLKLLKQQFSDLTGKELRLAALIKMNLSNKEIAPILSISVRGVETARYRLRKKLDIDQDKNMVQVFERMMEHREKENGKPNQN
ncbi:MAG: hypothetical protein JXQ90_08280 [Cyclobacteriaceae bacterium]